MAIALAVVFFAAGGFALTNIASGVEARSERETPATHDLRSEIAGLSRSIEGECKRRGDRCRDLEAKRDNASRRLEAERQSVRGSADPQATALGLSAADLHLTQAGAMVALCLASGLFISFGAGLIWPAREAT
jgi:hypothetical protein